MRLSEIQKRAHSTAKAKGFWEESISTIGLLAKLALVHSEISEAAEDLRKGAPSRIDGLPHGFVVELADAIIRIADLAEALGLDLEEAVEHKMSYNNSRPYMHGKLA